MLNRFRLANDYGANFINLILNDFKDRAIPDVLRRNMASDLFSISPLAAVKCCFINALFQAIDDDGGKDVVAIQVGDYSSMEAHLPQAFYRHLKSPSTGSEAITAILQILSKFGSMLLLSSVGSLVRSRINQFTFELLHRVGTIEAFRGLTKFESLGPLDTEAVQRAGWKKNAACVSFVASSTSPPTSSSSFVPMVHLKRKLMSSLTLGDLAEVGKYPEISTPIIVAAGQKFIEKNQFEEAHAFLNVCPTQAHNAIHIKVLSILCEELAYSKSFAFKEIYDALLTLLPQSPQAPADTQTCRLALTVALTRCSEESCVFLDAFVVKSGEVLETLLLSNKHFESIKLLSILAKVCNQLVRTYRSLIHDLPSSDELHNLGILHNLQEPQIVEVRNLAKELISSLAPGMQDAKFVKEFQAQLLMVLRATKNPDYIRIVGAVVGGFTSGLQPPGTRVQLRNFGPLAFLVSPAEIVSAEEEPWCSRIVALTKNQTDLASVMKIEGGYLVKFLLALYAIPNAFISNTAPVDPRKAAAVTAPAVSPSTFNSCFCLGDLSFSIGDYSSATRQYIHGLSILSSHFTNVDKMYEGYLGVKGWNHRFAQCLQISGLHMGAVFVMQLAGGVVPNLGSGSVGGGGGGGVGLGGIDYMAANGALESVVDGMGAGDVAEEVEKVFVYLYDMSLLEYVTYLFKKKKKTESMKAVVRLIGRRELGHGYDGLLQKQYLDRLQQKFFRDLPI
ncbi:hypothetical protein BDR26DRAFT_850190 [Obelidium mucronatum]|nr:hypothetical protein BDR26DRAFT_850190 [Obelidium mucronatum]